MPGGDGTGPVGMGPMTGRATGFCAGYPMPGYANPAGGRGFWGWGRGRGRGWRNQYYATGLPAWARSGYSAYPQNVPVPVNPEQEQQALKRQSEYLQNSLEAVKKRIQELEHENTP